MLIAGSHLNTSYGEKNPQTVAESTKDSIFQFSNL